MKLIIKCNSVGWLLGNALSAISNWQMNEYLNKPKTKKQQQKKNK